MCKISVIVPIYNVEPYLRKCIDSIVNQTFRDLEIVLVDDGSPDRCGEICDAYAAEDERVKVIHKQNGGLAFALNTGLEQATGEWVAFCDADDWMDTDYYERMLSTIKPGIVSDIHFSQGFYEEKADVPVMRHAYSVPIEVASGTQKQPHMIHTLVDTHGQNELLPANGFYWNKLYRRAFLRANGLHFSTDILSKDPWFDSLFNFKALCKAERVTGSGAVGYHYRQVSGSAVHRYNPYTVQSRVAYAHQITQSAQEYGMTAELQQAIYAKTVRGFGGCLLSIFHPDNTDSRAQRTEKIKELKKDPVMHKAIWSRSNQYFDHTLTFLKYALRLPWVWPLKALYSIEQAKRKRKRSTLY